MQSCWQTMEENTVEDYQCVAEKLLQCPKKAERTHPRRIDPRVAKATKELLQKRRIIKRDHINNVEYSLPCNLDWKLKEKMLEDGNNDWKEAMAETVQAREAALPSHNCGVEELGLTSGHWPKRNRRSMQEILHETVRFMNRHSSTSNPRH